MRLIEQGNTNFCPVDICARKIDFKSGHRLYKNLRSNIYIEKAVYMYVCICLYVSWGLSHGNYFFSLHLNNDTTK